MVSRAFRLLLFLSPIVIPVNTAVDVFDMIFFRTSVMVLFMASLLDKPKRSMPDWVNKVVIGLFSLCLLNLFNFKFSQTVLMNTLSLFIATMGFYILYTYCEKNIDIKRPIILAILVNLIILAFQGTGRDVIFDEVYQGGLIGNAARFGIYSALISSLVPDMFLLLTFFSVFVSKQTTILIPFALYAFMKVRWFNKKIFLTIFFIGVLLFMKDYIITEFAIRIKNAWIPILRVFFDRPLLGFGLGANPLPGTNIGLFQNSYLQFVTGVGILGVAWIAYAFREIFIHLKFDIKILPLVSLLLIMFIEYPIEIPKFWHIDIAILVYTLLHCQKKPAMEMIC
jgi:hypothetical protein